MRGHTTTQTRAVQIRAGAVLINGDLTIPERALGLVVFAHGSGSSPFSTRNWRKPVRSRKSFGSRWRGVSGTSPGDDQ